MSLLNRAEKIAVLLAVVTVASCSHATSRQPESGAVTFEDRLVIQENDDRSPLRIPPIQLPKAGECRLWKPGRPVKEQAAAGVCSQVEPAAPPESWVLYRPAQDPRLVQVRVIDQEQAGLVTQVRVYDAERGTYLGSKAKKPT